MFKKCDVYGADEVTLILLQKCFENYEDFNVTENKEKIVNVANINNLKICSK